ncbi:hypothetical protein GCM10007235_17190 [Pseudoxanthomonas indica]|nr:hypothetical protein GCM10007235_17190 [Pseudoxanthomonas indica]
MSRNTARKKARVNELADELTVAAAFRLRADTDSIRHIVDAVVAYLVEEYPSQDLYIPSGVTYPVEQIRADMASGMSIRKLCQKYRIDRRTLYRLLDEPTQPAC